MQQSFESTNHSQFVINRLAEGVTIKSFDCGDADLNDFILNECTLYRKEKLAITYVLEGNNDSTFVIQTCLSIAEPAPSLSNQAQDDYQRLMNNKSPKNKRK